MKNRYFLLHLHLDYTTNTNTGFTDILNYHLPIYDLPLNYIQIPLIFAYYQ